MIATTATVDRSTAALWGLAYGDAWGDPVEFMSMPAILRKGRGQGPALPYRLRITDDTQMSLAVFQAITDALTLTDYDLRDALFAELLAWRVDPDNNRAPGGSCLSSLSKLGRSRSPHADWASCSTMPGEKLTSGNGCGAVMRSAWIGLHPRLTNQADVAHVAQMQAVITHAHPAAPATAAAVALLTRALAAGEVQLGECGEYLLRLGGMLHGSAYNERALGEIAPLAWLDRDAYVSIGADAVRTAGGHAQLATITMLDAPTLWSVDPCSVAGEGWDNTTCLAVAAACADLVDAVGPTEALCRAAATNGDSDSIAAVTGALIGAGTGTAAWDASWASRIEPRYREWIARCAAGLGA